ncbi:MAG: hypothetical protein QM753_03175 [Thermomicrobiales bacterium]
MGVVQADPGTYLVLDVFGGRGFTFLTATKATVDAQPPGSDLTVTLRTW